MDLASDAFSFAHYSSLAEGLRIWQGGKDRMVFRGTKGDQSKSWPPMRGSDWLTTEPRRGIKLIILWHNQDPSPLKKSGIKDSWNELERLNEIQQNLLCNRKAAKICRESLPRFSYGHVGRKIVFGRIVYKQCYHSCKPSVSLPVIQNGKGKGMIHVRRTEQYTTSTSL